VRVCVRVCVAKRKREIKRGKKWKKENPRERRKKINQKREKQRQMVAGNNSRGGRVSVRVSSLDVRLRVRVCVCCRDVCVNVRVSS